MVRSLRQPRPGLWPLLVIAAVLLLALLLGQRASLTWLALLGAALGGAALLARPALGLPLLVIVALLIPFEATTGTEVRLNAVALLIPVVAAVWLLHRVRSSQMTWVASRVNRPLMLFLLSGLVSLVVGQATWDPAVAQNPNFWIVQLAQWGIFALSAVALWLTANLIHDERRLERLTWVFLLVGGGVAILRTIGLGSLVAGLPTVAFIRAPFWILLTSLSLGQLLFNRQLSRRGQLFLLASVVAVVIYAFFEQQEAVSNWVAVATVGGVLFWLRYRRLRVPVAVAIGVLLAIGLLFPAVYNFAGGEDEWLLSGGSRLTLIERVVSVAMRNPLLGVGPAAYRPYANATPLFYNGAYWVAPLINSHNNYIDLFAHVGVLGLGLFGWFSWELLQLGRKLTRRVSSGFARGFVYGMVAAWVGSLVVMLLADWILPFVYNIGFPGFQASVLVWLFLGGLLFLDQQPGSTYLN